MSAPGRPQWDYDKDFDIGFPKGKYMFAILLQPIELLLINDLDLLLPCMPCVEPRRADGQS